MSNESLTRAIWRAADAVCFDVDSTVCRDEAIDELAKFVGREKEVSELTKVAMRGGCTFQEALARRLALIQPSVDILKAYLREHPPRLTPGIKELIALLRGRGVAIYLVSGGFDTLIEPVAKELDIPIKNVFANSLKFYFDGSYAGFDETRPTSQQDGKARVIAFLKQQEGFRRVVMVGDGATDLEAFPPADAFIGFGGNQIRNKVKDEAKWFVLSFYDLIEELNRN
ncbi:phosphoserine phosphatase-like protein [Dinothrombium tinctorium]|uniref:Phosphoserine phosphatase n=1 Tax=Dinothrombium tinctorium TaxID=1965070 RepID=A0A3S3S1B1_9ACAR|nr:phosphoserine phosphatase-like protein [Dinothrombium tinctorium]RWS07798.1 phosphoserine phosphatase-like protein [Dinothrombium tinctorium]RWS07962.1 phosphoserine phosphatase-like protein [Dinothrombium tinctorium]